MECNRSEAARCLEMAAQKFTAQEYVAARTLALKAQQHFPSLENISQTIAVLDVHVAAQTRIGITEKDWYGILQIEPTADDAVVKKQYRKLALFLHPDKNKAIGAESAFKLIGEALQVLSDKVKRLVYDAKRGMHSRAATNTFSTNPTCAADGVNGWQSQMFFSQRQQQQQQQQRQQAPADVAVNSSTCTRPYFSHVPPTAPEFQLFTFWTACTSCQMRYQYYRKYEDQNLLCPQCRQPFIAKDLSSVPGINVAQVWPSRAGQSTIPGPHASQSSSHTAAKFESSNPHIFSTYNASSFKHLNGFSNGGRTDTYQMFAGSKTHANGNLGPSGAKIDTQFMSHAASMRASGNAEKELIRNLKELQRASAREQAKQKYQQKQHARSERSREYLANWFAKAGQVQNDSCVLNKLMSKKLNVDSSGSDSEGNRKEVRDDCKAYEGQASRFKRNAPCNSNGNRDSLPEVILGKKAKVEVEIKMSKQDSEADMAKRLADIAKNAIRVNLNLQMAKSLAAHSAPGTVLGRMESAPRVASGKRESTPSLVSGKKETTPGLAFGNQESAPGRKVKVEKCANGKTEDNVKDEKVVASCSVPDADFHNFDEGREEKDVEVGQVWALYDDKEGMPKYYMKVKEMRSRKPFKVMIGWFEIRKPSDTVCDLLDLGFSIACGEFRMVGSQVMDSVNSFSHRVEWEKSGKGLAKIYPKKGEIWCIYKDWEVGQQAVKAVDEEPLAYSLVEVVDGDSEEVSGAAFRLLKKVEGFKSVFESTNEPEVRVPISELLRFSHRVPAHGLKGTEAPGIPKGCWELDPAAVPSCLAQRDENGQEQAAAV